MRRHEPRGETAFAGDESEGRRRKHAGGDRFAAGPPDSVRQRCDDHGEDSRGSWPRQIRGATLALRRAR